MLTTKQQLEPILQDFTRLKNEWGFDENKGIEQLVELKLNPIDFNLEDAESILINYGRFRQCVDLIEKMS